jgi:putative Holliday junction resolvase
MGRVVSIDYGLARIGVAISDESRMISSFQKVLPTEKTLALTVKKLLEMLSPYKIDIVVVGMPLHLDGKMSPLAQEVKLFMTMLQEQVAWKICAWDERLTTKLAEKSLEHLSRKKRSEIVDAVTASLILRNYLDSHELASL